jgi:hypothetical protein
MLKILALGQKQVQAGKVTDHDALFDRLEAEDSNED